MQEALYLFCIAREGLMLEPAMAGLDDGSPLLQENFANITAVYCTVPLDDFSGPSAASRLENLAWIAPRALRHGEVIARVMVSSPVLPARFGTLFRSIQSIRHLLESNLTEIDRYLERVAGKDEWAVKGLMSRTKLRDRLCSEKIAAQQDLRASVPPGLRYFKERQLLASVDRDIGGWLKEVCRRVANLLTERSQDWHKREIVLRTGEESEEETFVNWAFLVERGRLGDFQSRLTAMNTEYDAFGVRFDLSGPWPPYSFAPSLSMKSEP